ncbi:Aspartyl/Asparaginyl-tRNA synthetase [Cinnamomum micranthum f. kanehirae]|uniref:Aspartyl/Asparaginyl-tRNA synthetase n=1 Tax=Cinnamomum micranthum f. kanehirae TaxID=337451 RepID=A0A3S3NHW3_9MAGN|nr:Aspartyl/Asparaginyl-tRNA synthetase [Cinnamomum micranthum f. kanehirae]
MGAVGSHGSMGSNGSPWESGHIPGFPPGCSDFGQFLLSEGFFKIHTPTLIAGSREGGSDVFKLDYKGPARLPSTFRPSVTSNSQYVVFAPIFRAEDSYTHWHLCDFIDLDVEMEIKEHYFEVIDIVDRAFVSVFDSSNEKCNKELDAIAKQYPFKPLEYLRKTLKLTFEEGMFGLRTIFVIGRFLQDPYSEAHSRLEEGGSDVFQTRLKGQRLPSTFSQDAGIEVDPLGDLNTQSERNRASLYDTEFYILYRYPLAVRPFYTMPCHDDPAYSNSIDAFLRGEEIILGGQRVHTPGFLTARTEECGIDGKTL